MVAVLAVALDAGATTVRRASLADLVGRAERVVRGDCVAVAGGAARLGGMPTTTVTIAVRETLKGPATAELTFTQLTALGPRFAVGEEVVLFLARPRRSGLTAPVGLTQGKLRIERRAGAPATVVPALDPPATSASRLQPAARDGSPPADLDRLLAAIRALVDGSSR